MEKGSEDTRLPVSLLCGFLGAGKTTLLKHILETKHEEEDFRCAVIVNDMAELNIDKSLIKQSAVVQSDEVIAMQNGCFCCSLQNNLVEMIIALVEKKMFNYMLIEASGVAEPSHIAPLFDLCDDEHTGDEADHDHEAVQLGEVARLDTCVTVVDSAEFYNNLASMGTYEQGVTTGSIAELMMEQVEFSNVVLLNKGDLISESQTADIIEKIEILNPKAKVLKTVESKVNVMDILNTHLYHEDQTKEEYWMTATKANVEKIEENLLDCCEKSLTTEGKKCCKSKNENYLDSGLSQVQLDVVADRTGVTRHKSRFGISSFIYRARRPFHPARLTDLFLEPFFCQREEEDTEENGEDSSLIQKHQSESAAKQIKRTQHLGEVLRSKGFIWIATSHKIMGSWQQAGSVIRLEAENPWMCQIREAWEDSPAAAAILRDMKHPDGEEYQFGDRRQELVFIGQRMKHNVIQLILDQCLLTDDEMALGASQWEQNMENVDKIRLMERFWTQDSTSMERYWDQHSIKTKTLIFDLD